MRVSVVVPNYNKERTLRDCLSAVYAQTVPPAEVIVVDDASTDRSRRIAAEFPCTVLAFPVNRGVSAARNAGAAQATGDVLFFVDSDIALAPDALAVAVRTLAAYPDCGVVQGIYDLRPLYDDGPVEAYKTLFEHFWRRRAAGLTTTTMFALTAVPKAVFDLVGGFDERLRDAEDVEFGTRLPQRYAIRVSAEMVGRHDDVDRLRPYLSELFRRAVTYAGAVVAGRWERPAAGAGGEARTPHRVDLGSVVGMVSSGLTVGTAPLILLSPWLAALPVTLVGAAIVADRELLAFALRHRGPRFLLYAAGLRWLTHLTEFVGMGLGVSGALLRRVRAVGSRPVTVASRR
ncbi:glycosyltransferase family 2 protein [Micromonospora zingiberis]|uniref:glycosyltransferase family 2 protein n=1 Tax=Micromonospora zingiberis TaxID=2053011 RepID=UPI001F0D0134|nr:glycosyltransferase family 2 protein [Micromonospora zingiberis]